MAEKINFEALERIDLEVAAFVESVGTVAGIISTAEASEQELSASLYVIAQSLAVAGAILYSGATGGLMGKAPIERETLQEEVA